MTTETLIVSDHKRNDKCRIWPEIKASVRRESGRPMMSIVAGSYRVGADYSITDEAKRYLDDRNLDDSGRAKLTTQILDTAMRLAEIPEVTKAMVDRAIIAQRLPVQSRADRLLLFIDDRCDEISETFFLIYEEHIDGALAWSESTTEEDLHYLWDYLHEMKWVAESKGGFTAPYNDCVITVAGHARIAELTSRRVDSAQAFVAMWFDSSMSDVYDNAIKPAIEEAGYEPVRIDRQHFTNTIDAEVIAQIRKSRFLVADFTHEVGKSVRGSVYYEAGFAYGLNIPVIFTAKDEHRIDLQFDVNHYLFIRWKSHDHLRKELKVRILALSELGQGPRRLRSSDSMGR